MRLYCWCHCDYAWLYNNISECYFFLPTLSTPMLLNLSFTHPPFSLYFRMLFFSSNIIHPNASQPFFHTSTLFFIFQNVIFFFQHYPPQCFSTFLSHVHPFLYISECYFFLPTLSTPKLLNLSFTHPPFSLYFRMLFFSSNIIHPNASQPFFHTSTLFFIFQNVIFFFQHYPPQCFSTFLSHIHPFLYISECYFFLLPTLSTPISASQPFFHTSTLFFIFQNVIFFFQHYPPQCFSTFLSHIHPFLYISECYFFLPTLSTPMLLNLSFTHPPFSLYFRMLFFSSNIIHPKASFLSHIHPFLYISECYFFLPTLSTPKLLNLSFTHPPFSLYFRMFFFSSNIIHPNASQPFFRTSTLFSIFQNVIFFFQHYPPQSFSTFLSHIHPFLYISECYFFLPTLSTPKLLNLSFTHPPFSLYFRMLFFSSNIIHPKASQPFFHTSTLFFIFQNVIFFFQHYPPQSFSTFLSHIHPFLYISECYFFLPTLSTPMLLNLSFTHPPFSLYFRMLFFSSNIIHPNASQPFFHTSTLFFIFQNVIFFFQHYPPQSFSTFLSHIHPFLYISECFFFLPTLSTPMLLNLSFARPPFSLYFRMLFFSSNIIHPKASQPFFHTSTLFFIFQNVIFFFQHYPPQSFSTFLSHIHPFLYISECYFFLPTLSTPKLLNLSFTHPPFSLYFRMLFFSSNIIHPKASQPFFHTSTLFFIFQNVIFFFQHYPPQCFSTFLSHIHPFLYISECYFLFLTLSTLMLLNLYLINSKEIVNFIILNLLS